MELIDDAKIELTQLLAPEVVGELGQLVIKRHMAGLLRPKLSAAGTKGQAYCAGTSPVCVAR